MSVFFDWLAAQRKREDAVGYLADLAVLDRSWPAHFNEWSNLRRCIKRGVAPHCDVPLEALLAMTRSALAEYQQVVEDESERERGEEDDGPGF